MLDAFYKKIKPHVTLPMGIILFVAGLGCVFGFNQIADIFGKDVVTLDGLLLKKGKIWYSPSDIQTLFNALGESNLRTYWISELTLDLVFPTVYVFLLTFLIIGIFPEKLAKYLIVIPLLAGLFDCLENFTIVFFAIKNSTSFVAYIAPLFTALKWLFSSISLIVILLGSVWEVGKRYLFSPNDEIRINKAA